MKRPTQAQIDAQNAIGAAWFEKEKLCLPVGEANLKREFLQLVKSPAERTVFFRSLMIFYWASKRTSVRPGKDEAAEVERAAILKTASLFADAVGGIDPKVAKTS